MDYLSNDYSKFEGSSSAFKPKASPLISGSTNSGIFETPNVVHRSFSGADPNAKIGDDTNSQGLSNSNCQLLTKEQKYDSIQLPTNIRVTASLINSLEGKDRIAKVLEFLLKFLGDFVAKSFVHFQELGNRNLEDDRDYRWRTVKAIAYFIPRAYVKISGSAEKFDERLEYIISQLENHRFFLRSGNYPILVYKFIRRLKITIMAFRGRKEVSETVGIKGVWFNESSLTDAIDFYFSVTDGMLLFNRLRLWSNVSLHTVALRHRNLAWQSRILLDLLRTWRRLNQLQNRETELRVQILVRERAVRYYNISPFNNQYNGEISPIRKQLLHDLRRGDDLSRATRNIEAQLEEIQRSRAICRLDLLRLLLDFTANSKNVFNLKLSSGTYNFLLLCSGVTELLKLWLYRKYQCMVPIEEQESILGL